MNTPNLLGTTKPRRFVLTVLAWIIALSFVVPLIWLLSGSLRTDADMFSSMYPLSWATFIPRDFTLDNYAAVLTGEFGRSIFNSVFVTVVTIAVGLGICATAAFALSVLRLRGAGFIFSLIVLSFLIPFDAIAIPLAVLFRDWSLTNTFAGLILPGLANGFAIFMLRQFFMDIPYELTEAARLDGLSWWGVFVRIYLPLSKTALIGAGLMLFLSAWGAYMWPLLIGTHPDKILAPVALANLNGQFEVQFGAMFAGSMVLTVVPMLLMLFFNKYFTASLSTTGSKG